MPGLSPGTPGAKEAYGISILREDLSIQIPPKAFRRYNLADNESVLLTSTRHDERGFAVMNLEKAKLSVFKKVIDKIDGIDQVYRINSRPYLITKVKNSKIYFDKDIVEGLDLEIGERYLIIKSTTMAMSYTPVDIWKRKFEKEGFLESIKNIDSLEIF